MCMGDDYPLSGVGGNRPLLFVIASPPPFVIAGEARQSVVSPPRLLSPDCIGTRKDMKGIGGKSMREAGMIRSAKMVIFFRSSAGLFHT